MGDMSAFFVDEPAIGNMGVEFVHQVSHSDSQDFTGSMFVEGHRDKRHLSLGMLVPDAIQHICSEGSALQWDEIHNFYEVDLFNILTQIEDI